MNILDTNAVAYIFANNITLKERYFLPPDVKEESEMTELVHGRRLPTNIDEIEGNELFDLSSYLKHYNIILNKYGGRSFFNMTGFGDVSTLATVHALLEVVDEQAKEQLFKTVDDILVFTGDEGLIKKFGKEFAGKPVIVKSLTDLK